MSEPHKGTLQFAIVNQALDNRKLLKIVRKIQVSRPDLSFCEFLATYQVLKSGRSTQGKQVETFENDFKAYLGTKHAYALNSGTSALVLSLMALGVKSSDEVIVPNFTFGATANAVLLVGAKPILVDIETKTFALNAIKILEAITSRTKEVHPQIMTILRDFEFQAGRI